MTAKVDGLPVAGYQPQSTSNIDLVNRNKAAEERTLRILDELRETPGVDGRWLAIGRTQLEQAFMAINRAIFQPARVTLPAEQADIEAIAKACHEANRGYCAALGDLSQPAWEDAPDWQKASARMGVHFIINHPDAGPSASHESWLEQKRAEGWGYGAKKDPEAKTHPCFVPYDELPAEQKAKDYIFGAIVRSMI